MSNSFSMDDLQKKPGESEEDYQKRLEALSQVAGADNDLITVEENAIVAQEQLDTLKHIIADSITDDFSRDPDDD